MKKIMFISLIFFGLFIFSGGFILLNDSFVAQNEDDNVSKNATYSVTFDANGGSGGYTQSVEISSSSRTMLSFPTVSRTGYSFTGWKMETQMIDPYSSTNAAPYFSSSNSGGLYGIWYGGSIFPTNPGSVIKYDVYINDNGLSEFVGGAKVAYFTSKTGYYVDYSGPSGEYTSSVYMDVCETEYVDTVPSSCYSVGFWCGESNGSYVNIENILVNWETTTMRPSNVYAVGSVKYVAQWKSTATLNSLTVKYYSQNASHSTNLNISALNCTVSSSSIAYNGSATVSHASTSTAYTITFSRANSSYNYYLKYGSAPTATSFSGINSFTYSWVPSSNATINIYIYERYTVSFNENGGTVPYSVNTYFQSWYYVDGDRFQIQDLPTGVGIGVETFTQLELTFYAMAGSQVVFNVRLYLGSSDAFALFSMLDTQLDSSDPTANVQDSFDGYHGLEIYSDVIYNVSSTGSHKIDVVLANSDTSTLSWADIELVEQSERKMPPTQYKIHGTSLTIPANNLTKTGYTANGWNSNSSGTGTNYSTSYTTNASATLYAKWTRKVVTIYLRFYTDETGNGAVYKNSSTGASNFTVEFYRDNGGTPLKDSYSYDGHTFSSGYYSLSGMQLLEYQYFVNILPYSGYFFTGFSRSTTGSMSGLYSDITPSSSLYPSSSSSVPSQTYSFTPTSTTTQYIYCFFKKISSLNQMKYDSSEKYFYFEDGEYPQTYVGDSMNNTLNGATSSQLTKQYDLTYNNGTSNVNIPVYTYTDGKKYARVESNGQVKWFKVEPIRWRVSNYGVSNTSYPSGWTSYGAYNTNFTAVTDRVIGIGAFTSQNTLEGWNSKDSELYKNTLANSEKIGLNFDAKNVGMKIYEYGGTAQQVKVLSEDITYTGMRVASVEDVKTNLTDMSAKASDMVKFILNASADKVDYWTRELGNSLDNGKVVTSAGLERNKWLDELNGVRFAVTFSEGIRV